MLQAQHPRFPPRIHTGVHPYACECMTNAAAKPDPERRRNAALRELIDELLFKVRDANQRIDFWTPEERARAEEELNMIMSRVRGAALHKGN